MSNKALLNTLSRCKIILDNKQSIIHRKWNDQLEMIGFEWSCGVCTNIEFKYVRDDVTNDGEYMLTSLGREMRPWAYDENEHVMLFHYLSMLFALDNPDMKDVQKSQYPHYPVGGEVEFDKCMFDVIFWENHKRFEFVKFIYDHLHEYYQSGEIKIDKRILIKDPKRK